MIEKLIRKLKGNNEYKWESTYSTCDLLAVAWMRAWQVFRGLFLKPFLKRSSGLLFVGTSVKVRHGYQLSAGRQLILGDNVSIDALSEKGIIMGDNVSIGRDSIIFCTGVIAQKGTGIVIGDRTGINARAYLAGQGGIVIGNDVIMGPNVHIFSEEHNFSDLNSTIKDQGVTRKSVTIGNDCWLGADSKILAGVTIGNGCVIAAGSVVTRSMPDNSVIAGVPAKVIKSRTADQYE